MSSLRLRQVWLAIGVLLITFVVYASVAPDVYTLPGEEGDKMGHALAYGVLMAWFAQIERRRIIRMSYALGFVALAVALEFVQDAVPYRTFDVRDMLSGVIGVAMGWVSAPPRGPDVYRWIARAVAGG